MNRRSIIETLLIGQLAIASGYSSAAPAILSKAERQKWIATVELNAETPENPDDYIWETKGLNPNQTTIPLISFDENGKEHITGSLPVGAKIVPAYVRIYSRKLHYGIRQGSSAVTTDPASIKWIPGDFLKLAGFATAK